MLKLKPGECMVDKDFYLYGDPSIKITDKDFELYREIRIKNARAARRTERLYGFLNVVGVSCSFGLVLMIWFIF